MKPENSSSRVRRSRAPGLAFVTWLAFTACCTGCEPQLVEELAPQPTLLIDGRAATKLALSIDPSVQDTFENAYPHYVFSAWRTSLRNGFRAGFGPWFTVVPEAGDLTLEIVQADATVLILGRYVYSYRIRYRARLLDKSGAPVADSAGNVSGDSTKEAVEAMYEEIANHFFGHVARRP